jgi:hypothetical protein
MLEVSGAHRIDDHRRARSVRFIAFEQAFQPAVE